jgi:DNA helicase HerA-like ATPase
MLGYLELFFGKSFTGKTARMLHEVRAVPRLVILDPKCAQLAELKGFDHVWPELTDGKTLAWSGSENPVEYFRKRLSSPRFRVVIHARAHFREQLEMLCRLLRAVGRLTLAVDELGLFIPSAGPSLPPAITSAMISGRHEGLSFCGTAQRPALVHVTARANAERIRWFRITEGNDLEAARGYMPDSLADSLPFLPDYVCIETSDGSPAFRDESMVGKIRVFGSPAKKPRS